MYRHEAFDDETSELEAKYFLLLATLPEGDLVARLLTSRQHGRPESPACFHGHPYSSFYLGVLGGPLSAKSWLDFRYLEDFDGVEFQRRLQTKRIRLIMTVSRQCFSTPWTVPQGLMTLVVLKSAPSAISYHASGRRSSAHATSARRAKDSAVIVYLLQPSCSSQEL